MAGGSDSSDDENVNYLIAAGIFPALKQREKHARALFEVNIQMRQGNLTLRTSGSLITTLFKAPCREVTKI